MAPRADLAKIGKEGFDIINEHFGHKRVPRADLAELGREGFDIIDEHLGRNKGKKISQPGVAHAAHTFPPRELRDCRPAVAYGARIADFRPKNAPRKVY